MTDEHLSQPVSPPQASQQKDADQKDQTAKASRRQRDAAQDDSLPDLPDILARTKFFPEAAKLFTFRRQPIDRVKDDFIAVLGACLRIPVSVVADAPCVQAESIWAQCGFPTFLPP
jgi:hypothetical protein